MENQLVSRVSHLPKTERIKRAAEQQSVAKLKAAKKKRFEKIAVLRAKHAAKQAQASNLEGLSTKAHNEEGDSRRFERSKREYNDVTTSAKDEGSSSSSLPMQVPMVQGILVDGHMKTKKIHCKQMQEIEELD